MGQLTIQSFGFLKGFQEDIKIIIIIIIIIITITITITITIIIASWLVRTLVASPQTSGSCRIYIYSSESNWTVRDHRWIDGCILWFQNEIESNPPVQTVRITAKQSRHNFNPQPYVYLCTDTLYTYMCTYIELMIYIYIYTYIYVYIYTFPYL